MGHRMRVGTRDPDTLLRDRKRLWSAVIGSGVLLMMAVTGCRTTDDTRPGQALELSCADPVVTSLGVPTARNRARLTTSGGLHRFVVKALPPGSIFGEVNDTEVQLSDPDTPTVRYRVTTSPREPGVVEVQAGTYSVLNTNSGRIVVEVCPDVTISDVAPAIPNWRGLD